MYNVKLCLCVCLGKIDVHNNVTLIYSHRILDKMSRGWGTRREFEELQKFSRRRGVISNDLEWVTLNPGFKVTVDANEVKKEMKKTLSKDAKMWQ